MRNSQLNCLVFPNFHTIDEFSLRVGKSIIVVASWNMTKQCADISMKKKHVLLNLEFHSQIRLIESVRMRYNIASSSFNLITFFCTCSAISLINLMGTHFTCVLPGLWNALRLYRHVVWVLTITLRYQTRLLLNSSQCTWEKFVFASSTLYVWAVTFFVLKLKPDIGIKVVCWLKIFTVYW